MGGQVRLAGQPVHPMLVLFSLAVFAMVLLFDGGALVSGWSLLADIGYWELAAGLTVCGMAALAGVVELLTAPRSGRARVRVSAWGVANLGMLAIFAMVWLARGGDHDRALPVLLLIEVAAFVAGVRAAWTGRREPGPVPI